MDGNDYQQQTLRFDNHYSHLRLPAVVLGLCAEAGEVANEVERSYRHSQKGFDYDRVEKVKTELGDVMWNVAGIADALGITLNEIMEHNITKLTDRYASEGLTVTEP